MNGLFLAASAAAAGTQAYHAGQAASSASAKARRATTEVNLLGADIEKLLMITEALWTVLKEKHGYTDDDLIRRITEIDIRDGKLDGKVAKSPPVECHRCGRTALGRHPACLYCGAIIKHDPFSR